MQLHNELLQLRKKEQELAHIILEKLQMMEEGRKYLHLGYSSLFDYLVRGLGYSESSAYRRQSCLRLTKELPEVKEKIQSGALTTAGLGMVFKTLKGKTIQEKRQLLSKIEHQPSRSIKRILVQETTAPEIQIRKTEYRDKVILRLELSHDFNQKVERLKALKSHSGGLEDLFEKLIDKELKKYEVKKNKLKPKTIAKAPREIQKSAKATKKAQEAQAAQKTQRTKEIRETRRTGKTRYIHRQLRNELLHEANFKCQQLGCEDTHFLQMDHVKPLRWGGPTTKENLQVLCGAHNRMKG